MKLTVTLLLLIAAAYAADVRQTARSRQKVEDTKTDKRELAEGNAAVEKRAPVLPTVPPSVTPGIEYADSKESQPDKSPSQQVYATPLPQITKISDLLTAQGPPFQAAIASHLLAPVSVYQPRLAAPTTYEVSSPIASQLAYSEHKISYQPPQNAIQYQPVQYNQKLQASKQANFARPINFQQPYQQQIFVQPQPVVYSQPPQLVPIPQPVQYQQIPFQVQRNAQYTQQNGFPQRLVSPAFNQQTLVRIAAPVQPGITYAREESREESKQASQEQQTSEEQPQEAARASENPTPAPEKKYNNQPQGAVSYASFSQSQPAPSFAPRSRLQYQPQPQYEPQPVQYQAQPQQYHVQPQQFQAQPQQYQTQPQTFQVQPLFHNQPAQQQPSQYEIQIQYQTPQNTGSKLSQETISTASTKTLPVSPQRPIAYFRPGPVLQNIQPFPQGHQAFSQGHQVYPQGQQVLLQGPVQVPQHSLQVPSFPPVQYFGKFAQSIFGGVHH